MKNKDNKYYAEDGMFIVRKEDNFIMGESIDLGSADSIDNYTEEAYTEESYEEFYKSIGMESPKSINKKNKEVSNEYTNI